MREKGRTALQIISEPGQFNGYGKTVNEKDYSNKAAYNEAVALATKLVDNKKIPDTTGGAYFFSRFEGDFMDQGWAKGKIKSSGKEGGLYLFKWI